MAVKWFVEEDNHETAKALIYDVDAWIAPEFLMVEIGNVMRTRMRAGLTEMRQARDGMAFVNETVDRFVADGELVRAAFEIAIDLDHSLYDCLYVACARRENTQMITADRRLIAKAAGSPYAGDVRALAA
ncbi:type II toxin-antitoxin system VapC family toxin [Pararhizobium mangrovi]|uniref:type II toxin-antitoxin system VapC family toxin n=1 Tax=Pararhizobium mangrovi TaxID=2590452 RepID=UPI0015E8544B|nr:type II toxin-antitoxin system VapC family toxin [Pararhizobium mangrovi]